MDATDSTDDDGDARRDGVSPDAASGAEPRLLPGHTASCFGCGGDNASGFHLQVWRAGDEIYTDVAFDERHVGAPGLAHGGAIAAACDEMLGFTVWLIGAPAVTRALTLDYLAPVALHERHRITAQSRRREASRDPCFGQGSARREAVVHCQRGIRPGAL